MTTLKATLEQRNQLRAWFTTVDSAKGPAILDNLDTLIRENEALREQIDFAESNYDMELIGKELEIEKLKENAHAPQK